MTNIEIAEKVLQAYIKGLNFTKPPELKRVPNEELEFDEPEYSLVLDGWIYLTPNTERNELVWGHVVYHHGVRYFKDGSGEPPEDEYIEDHATSNPYTAAFKMIQRYVENLLDGIGEGIAETIMEEQYGHCNPDSES